MVTITNGIRTFRVTSGAVKVYESMGFHVVSNEFLEETEQIKQEYHNDKVEDEKSKEKSLSKNESLNNVNKKDDIFVEELLEKPLSQWSSDEIKEFVKIKGIDTSEAQKVSQVRGIIKTYLEEQNKNV